MRFMKVITAHLYLASVPRSYTSWLLASNAFSFELRASIRKLFQGPFPLFSKVCHLTHVTYLMLWNVLKPRKMKCKNGRAFLAKANHTAFISRIEIVALATRACSILARSEHCSVRCGGQWDRRQVVTRFRSLIRSPERQGHGVRAAVLRLSSLSRRWLPDEGAINFLRGGQQRGWKDAAVTYETRVCVFSAWACFLQASWEFCLLPLQESFLRVQFWWAVLPTSG